MKARPTQRLIQRARAMLAKLTVVISQRSRPAAATAALAAVTAGLYLERPSLALIIPGALVFASLAWTHLKGPHA